MNPVTRIKELIPKLREADTAYFKLDAPLMTDLEYDRLDDELKHREEESGVTLAASPTQRVPGEVLEGLTAITHTRPMLSADKTKSVQEIHKFLDGRRAVLSWKLDGLTLVLCYDGGRLVKAITQGDGLKGEDVTP